MTFDKRDKPIRSSAGGQISPGGLVLHEGRFVMFVKRHEGYEAK